jgi:hypothetical protein
MIHQVFFFFLVCMSVLVASFSSYIYIGIILRVKIYMKPKGASS